MVPGARVGRRDGRSNGGSRTAAPARAGRNDSRTYWGRELPWATVATIPGARSLHQGPLPPWAGKPRAGREDVRSSIDVLTEAGNLVRLVKDEVRLAYAGSDVSSGGGDSIGGVFEAAGLERTYPKGWLYLQWKTGVVSTLTWQGGGGALSDGIARFPGYQAGDFNYYTRVDPDGAVVRKDFGSPGKDLIRAKDPEIVDYTSFDLTHCLLRKNGEVVVCNEQNEGNRPAAGDGAGPGSLLRSPAWTPAPLSSSACSSPAPPRPSGTTP